MANATLNGKRLKELEAQRQAWLVTINAVLAKDEAARTQQDLQQVQAINENWKNWEAEYTQLSSMNAMVDKIVIYGETPELPQSGSLGTGKKSVNYRTEPFKWTSSSARQRSFNPSSDERRIFASQEFGEVYNQFLRNPKSFRDGDALAKFCESRNIGHAETYNILRMDDDARGGVFAMPEEMLAGWLNELDNQTFIAANAREIVVNSTDSIGIRRRTAKANYVGPQSEIGNSLKNLETSLRLGKRSMKCNRFSIVALMSNELLEHTATPIQQLYTDEIKLAGGEWLEQKGLTGSGVGEPLGIFTVDSENGLGTDRDIAVEAADFSATKPESWSEQTKFAYGTVLRTYFGMKPGHRMKARWMFHSNQMINIAQMTDDSGRIIWQPSAREGEPSRLLGLPIDESLWLSGNEEADEYFGCLANWDYYWLVWHRKASWNVYKEIMALQGITVMLMTFDMDGQPVLPEAFLRMKYAA